MHSHPRWISWAIVALAFALRVACLEVKPAHFDEGVNGWFVDSMTRQGYYHYDPTNFHGPLHFYALFVSQTLFGRSLWALRLPVVLVSTGGVVLVLAYRRYFGERVCQVAALAMAVSPGVVYFGRDAIHETWLLFFLLLTAWGLAGLWHHGQRRDLWAAALGVTGMILTKETYLIHVVAFLLAVPCLLAYEKLSRSIPFRFGHWKITPRDLLTVGGVSLGLIVFFYSGALLDWPGPRTFDADGQPLPLGAVAGLWETHAAWMHTGVTKPTGHEKDWWYWLELMGRYEWPALIGLGASLWLLTPRRHRVARYLAISGLGALIGYSLIPYKTPWCLISLLWPFYFIFGLAVVRAAQKVDAWAGGVLAGTVCLYSLGASLKLNFHDFADEGEPYVYVQTRTDVNQLLTPLRALAARDPRNLFLRGHIILPEQHPLSWLLADYPFIDYPHFDSLPAELDAEFLLIDDPLVEQIEPQLRAPYFKISLRIRGASADSATLYLRGATFAPFVAEDTPRFQPALTPADEDPGKF